MEQIEMDLVHEVGATIRRFRDIHGLSQRALAASTGWPQATLSRVEPDASGMSVGRVEELLRHTGHRWAIVRVDAGADGP